MKTSHLALLFAASSLIACSAPSDEKKKDYEEVRSSLARETTPTLTASELDELSTDRADFAVEIYNAVRKTGEFANQDVFISPHGLSTCLAMAYAGAAGETKAEMKKALHFGLPDDRLHRGFDYLDLALSSRGKNAHGKDGKPFRLSIANSIWGQKGVAFEAPFLDTLAVNYGAGLNAVDFVNAAESARVAINGWAADNTENRIREVYPPSGLDQNTRLVLVNAVYFNAAWSTPFTDGATAPAAFTRLDGSTAQVPTMHTEIETGYSKTAGFEAVELPYEGHELSMFVIAPTTGTFATFESSMTGKTVLDVLAGLESKIVTLSFPKAKLEQTFQLREPLEALGMKSAFGAANFSALSKSIALQIASVQQKTFLELDEKGTEAAAVTSAAVGLPTADPEPPPRVTMNVDRPYIMAIVDRQTKTLVFLGRILEPKS